MRGYSIIILMTVMVFSACHQLTNDIDAERKSTENGTVEQFYPDGTLKNSIAIKDGMRHGKARRYYKSGTLQQEINYVKNKKHGEAITYYKNGGKYQVTPYVEGKIEGVRKKFRRNGALAAEIPFRDGQICAGLREYLLNEEQKKGYPELIITTQDDLEENNKYILKLSTTSNTTDVQYFNGNLSVDGCIPHYLSPIGSVIDGKAEIIYKLPKNAFIMEELNFIAKIKTRQGNFYITEKPFYLAVDNR